MVSHVCAKTTLRGRMAEDLARRLLDAVSDAVVVVDEEHRISLVNKAACSLYEVTAEEVLGGRIRSYLSALWPDAGQVAHAIDSVRAEGCWRGQARHATSDGREFDADVTMGELRDAEGLVAGFIAVVRDISDRVRVERELADTLATAEADRRRLRQILDNIPIAIGLSDADGRVVEVNAGIEKVWAGYRRPTCVEDYGAFKAWRVQDGRPVGPDDWTSIRALRSREAIHDELLEIERFDGTRGFVRSSAVPLIDDAGGVQGVVGVVEDVTESHQRLQLADALVEIESIIHSSLDPETVVEGVIGRAIRAMPADALTILLWEDGGWKVLAAANVDETLMGRSDPSRFPTATKARETKAIVVVDDFDAFLEDGELEREDETVSLLAAPLIVREEVTGAIVFRTYTPVHFTEAQIAFARELASSTALALENARLYDAQRQSAVLNEALARIDRQLHSAAGLDRIVGRALDLGARALGAESATLVQRDDPDGPVVISARNFSPDITGTRLTNSQDLHGEVSAKTGHVVAIDDVLGSDLFPQELAEQYGLRSVIVAPLKIRGRAFATIYFNYHSTPHRFTAAERAFVSNLASSLSLAIHNHRLNEEQAERVALSTALNEIDTIVAQTIDIESALRGVLDIACRTVEADAGAVLMANGNTWFGAAAYGRIEEYEGKTVELPLAAERLPAMDREAKLIDRHTADTELRAEVLDAFGHTSALVVPLVRADYPLGALVLARSDDSDWGALKSEFATAVGAHISLAAQTANLFELQRRRAQLGQLLNEIDAIIHSALRFEDVMTLSIAKGATAIGADSGSIALKEPSGWAVRYEHGLGTGFLAYTYPDEDVPFVEKMKADRQPLVFEYDDGEAEVIELAGQVHRFTSVLVAPLVVRGQVFGLVYFNRHETSERFGPEHLDFARKLSASVSLALENLRLYEEERRSVRFAEALNAVNELLLSTLSIEEMLERIVAQASQAAGADLSVLMRYDSDGWLVASMHEAPERLRGTRLPHHFSALADEAIASGEPVLTEDVCEDARANEGVAELFGWRSFMLVPLRLGKEPLGVVYFAYREPSQFRRGEVEFVKRLSTAITLALENARLYQAERQIAETLQETLLVMPHHIKGIDFARLYRSATVSARVGGDFIDAFQLSPRRISLALGDVSGKGLSAASLTAMVRNTLRAHTVDGLPPALVADKTNNVLQLFTASDTFVTAFFGTLDAHSGRLVYVSAGHPPSFIVSGHGEVRALTTQSPVLGAFPDVPYREGLAVLEPNDLLFAYSDGVIEARGPQGLFGEERLCDLLSHLGGADPREVVRTVFDAVGAYAEGQLRDDIALLAICRERLGAQEDEGVQEELDL